MGICVNFNIRENVGLLAAGISLVLSGCTANRVAGDTPLAINALDTGTTNSLSSANDPNLPPGLTLEAATGRLNQIRLAHHLAVFAADPRLMQAAQNHAIYMSTRGVYGHEFGPQTKFQRRIFAVGFRNSAGENIGVGYQNLDAAIEGWMNSAGHRRNMLKRNFSLFGLAYARNISGKNPRIDHYWVLIMGAPEGRRQVATMGFNPL